MSDPSMISMEERGEEEGSKIAEEVEGDEEVCYPTTFSLIAISFISK